MIKRIVFILLRFLFYLSASFASAVSGYYLLIAIFPKNYVFGSWFRMFPYHYNYPVFYILIPCIIYSCIVVLFDKRFIDKKFSKRISALLAIVFITVFISLPFGGMLYFYNDMEAGYFPENWIQRMIENGISTGFGIGWLIIVLSFPYNLLGIVVCYYITKCGSRIFHKKGSEITL